MYSFKLLHYPYWNVLALTSDYWKKISACGPLFITNIWHGESLLEFELLQRKSHVMLSD
jgi:hypothetical protein